MLEATRAWLTPQRLVQCDTRISLASLRHATSKYDSQACGEWQAFKDVSNRRRRVPACL